MHNEKRKLLLWLDLFANSRTADHYFSGNVNPSMDEGAIAIGGVRTIIKDQVEQTFRNSDAIQAKAMVNPIPTGMPPDEAARMANEVMETVEGLVSMTLEQGRKKAPESDQPLNNEQPLDKLARMSDLDPAPVQSQNQEWSWTSLPDPTLHTDIRASAIKAEDMRCVRTPQSAAVTLQAAKDQLMARLQDSSPGEEGDEHDPYAGSENDEEGDIRGSDVAADGSVADNNDEEDEDYRGPGDQERGLLTDIPLVLGPQEIEALPMIIQAGIVGGQGAKTGIEGKDTQDMQGVRCNILLAQEAGRNLLRELLIFIAAWDLQDDEFYFKMMMQIMEAILENGLMPFAYQAFGEVKDIVSPAQSMVIKILTQIFRGKQGLSSASRAPIAAAVNPRREAPTRVDLLIVKYIFTIFRQCIIPETCALIYLQGQIRAGAALPEDFPLNLWDMERVYEGVYQFLEFFAVLTESEDWKGLLVSWEIVSELVTLLRELDASIPKAPLGPLPQTAANAEAVSEPGQASDQQPLPPVAVERPYDHVTDPNFQPADYADGSASESPSQAIDNADPSDFEWRNLKKLVVLVLSSLVWKSTTVQNQIRQYGGVEMILSCCNFDANNPYIREHAIMCLRFLLEGNRENQEIVRVLEPKKAVPDEVMDKRGYETYIDEKGKVGLRAKEGGGVVPI